MIGDTVVETARSVVEFWRAAGPQRWFVRDDAFDKAFRQRFLEMHYTAAARGCEEWLYDAEGALALQILLDQFPRNCFRGTAHSYATDGLARHYAMRSIEEGLDRLHAMVARISRRRAVHPAEALVHAFNRHASGVRAADTEGQPVAPAVRLAALSAPIELSNAGVESGDQRSGGEQVRVRADLLERLVNYAGEVAIYRARLEQQLGAFRSAMAEMEQTNTRLRDQLRRLDIETEAQIIARYQREHEVGDPTFDPLELDRFSTLQQLSRGLGESANDLSSLQGSMEDLTRQYETLLTQQSRVSTELQEGLMRTRMVPVEGILPRLRRVVRQSAAETGKQVELLLDGAHGELDRNVLDRMLAPLEHLLRNESPGSRAFDADQLTTVLSKQSFVKKRSVTASIKPYMPSINYFVLNKKKTKRWEQPVIK